ncbi:MAG: hypothetical protein ACE37N_05420 [Pseudohongiellaceae bacterium]
MNESGDAGSYLTAIPVLVAAYLLLLHPASWFIKTVLKRWIEQLPQNSTSLISAGAMIGFLERFLMLTFILLEEYTAVGFVLALKAAYRFKDTAEHPQAEYMLMGTFLSLTVTLIVGLAAKTLLGVL